MTNTVNLGRTQVSDYDVFWNNYALGAVDKVTPDLKPVTKPIKVGTLGDVMVGERFIGLEGKITVEVREIDKAAAQQLLAWNAGSATASVPFQPPSYHEDLYDFAQQLTIHPTFMGTNTTLDQIFTKAVPILLEGLGERDGVGDDKMKVEFRIYPDRAQLLASPPAVKYATVG